MMELGYIIYPAENPHAVGHPQLDINLYNAPTGAHIDPQSVSLFINDPTKGVQHETLYHPVDPGTNQVCIGRIIVVSFDKKEVEFFSFGGELQVTNLDDYTLCRLICPAPLFDLGRFAEDELDLVCEYEVQLAMLRASWRRDDLEFGQRLAAIDPKTLFIALTGAVEERLRMMPASSHNDSYWRLRHTLQSAIRFIEPDGQLPADSPTLATLL
jgi:hypothetical protein